MREEIIKHITELEAKENITIHLAVESGSRAWGCPSPDSDYDVRIIFVRPKEKYMQIDEPTDTLDYFHGDLLDINGWDFKKVCKLIRKSNVTPFEWAQSPMVYKEVNNFSETVLALSKAYFQAKHAINHYRGIAKNCYMSGLSDGKIKLKKLFYVLRPLMAAHWIIEKKEIPPMDIPKLLPIIKDADIVAEIHTLLEIKQQANEDYVHSIEDKLIQFIDAQFAYIDAAKFEETVPKKDTTELNLAFQKSIAWRNDD